MLGGFRRLNYLLTWLISRKNPHTRRAVERYHICCILLVFLVQKTVFETSAVLEISIPWSSSSLYIYLEPSSQLPIYKVTIDPWFQIYGELEDQGIVLKKQVIFNRFENTDPSQHHLCIFELSARQAPTNLRKIFPKVKHTNIAKKTMTKNLKEKLGSSFSWSTVPKKTWGYVGSNQNQSTGRGYVLEEEKPKKTSRWAPKSSYTWGYFTPIKGRK